MNRREFLAATAITLGGCATPNNEEPAPIGHARRSGPTIVLVHGAWHGGWCWSMVQSRLQTAGCSVIAPSLTGLGERAHLRSPVPNLSTHIDDIQRLIEWEELSDVVLVGHSYGGMIITALADRLPSRLRHVVYLDAALPQHGDSMLTHSPNSTPATAARVLEQLTALAPDGIWMDPLPPTAFGIPSIDEQLTNWVKSRLTAHPLPSWTEVVSLPNSHQYESVAKTYLLCTESPPQLSAFTAHAARIRADEAGRNWRVRELHTSHDAMILDPDGVAQEIIAVLPEYA